MHHQRFYRVIDVAGYIGLHEDLLEAIPIVLIHYFCRWLAYVVCDFVNFADVAPNASDNGLSTITERDFDAAGCCGH